jgi:glutamate carboxypeptidase
MLTMWKAIVSLLLVALTGSALAAAGQGLSAKEQRIVASVDARLAEATTLIERVVNMPSATQNLQGVRRVGDVFRQEFDSLGFTTRWVDMPAEMQRAGHLIAEHEGRQGKRLLLLGHLDTVLEGERFRRNGATAHGTGVNDMKGGDVILLFALKALKDAGLLEPVRVSVMLTGDEESSGEPHEISRGDMVTLAKRSDVALSFEAAVRDTATVARRGFSDFTLEVQGSTGHSMGIFGPDRGAGAIFEASRILTEFYEQLRGEPYLTFNPSVIVGGSDVQFDTDHGTATGKTNVVPGKVVVRGDLRFISEEQKESVRNRMREIVRQHLPRTDATITFGDGTPAMSPAPANTQLLELLSRASLDLGATAIKALDASERGAGDISYVAPYVSGLDGLGIKGEGSHAPGETADLDSLPLLIKRTALLLYRLSLQN